MATPSLARAIEWAKMRANAEALLSRIDADAVVARQQRAKIARPRAERALKFCDDELYERFRSASANATEWPGLRSEYDKESGKVEFLAAPVKLQVQEESTPAARGKKTTITNQRRVRCVRSSGDFPPPSPQAEKAAARQDQTGTRQRDYGA